MDAYREELRQKIVQPKRRSASTNSEAARGFGVSLSLLKTLRQGRQGWDVARAVEGSGKNPTDEKGVQERRVGVHSGKTGGKAIIPIERGRSLILSE